MKVNVQNNNYAINDIHGNAHVGEKSYDSGFKHDFFFISPQS